MALEHRCLVVLFLLTLVGCGYVQSGTWEDDPQNWERAFHSTRPDDVEVVHSLYHRAAHWSYEFEYYFEIAANAALREQLFTENELVRLEGEDAVRRKRGLGDAPPWFAPKPAAGYELWVYADRSGSFLVLVDRETGALFLTDSQV